jgi:hypothetical protein
MVTQCSELLWWVSPLALLIANARIDIVIERTSPRVQSAAESVSTDYGRFPAPQVLIRITPSVHAECRP